MEILLLLTIMIKMDSRLREAGSALCADLWGQILFATKRDLVAMAYKIPMNLWDFHCPNTSLQTKTLLDIFFGALVYFTYFVLQDNLGVTQAKFFV
jgi:hypothetical protein